MTALELRLPARVRPQSWHRPLMLFAGLMFVLIIISLAGLLFDHRILGGVPIWLKPFKFAVSLTIYSVTLAWMLSLQQKARRTGWVLGTVIVAAGLGEMVLIVLQVLRGTASHFNVSTPFDAMVYGIMGMTITVLFLAMVVLAGVLAFQPTQDRALRWSIRFGLVSSVAGMAVAVLMLGNFSSAEIAAMHAGTPTMLGGHSIGVPDGGPAMPVTGWSTTGGDLRIPHFVGLHGLQALPLLGLLLAALADRFPVLRDERVRTRLVVVGAVFWGGLFSLVTWQALRGQPLIHPDGRTLTALAVLVVVVALAAITVVGTARNSRLAAT